MNNNLIAHLEMLKLSIRLGPAVCRAWFYCKSCHEGVRDENQIKKCKCKNLAKFRTGVRAVQLVGRASE